MSWDFSSGGANQNFGRRPRNGGEWHYGRDYGTRGKTNVPLGVPKYCDGWTCHILKNNKFDGLGNQVVLISPNGKEMVKFAHISTGTFSHLRSGRTVHEGDWIGNIGGVGNKETSYQPHIHVEHGFNPKYRLVRVSDKPYSRSIMTWVCGDGHIKNYKDPALAVLPYRELETLTNKALKSREMTLAKQAEDPFMIIGNGLKDIGTGIVDGVKGFFSWVEKDAVPWVKTSWLGSFFWGDETKTKNGATVRMASRKTVPAVKNEPTLFSKATPVKDAPAQTSSAQATLAKAQTQPFKATNKPSQNTEPEYVDYSITTKDGRVVKMRFKNSNATKTLARSSRTATGGRSYSSNQQRRGRGNGHS